MWHHLLSQVNNRLDAMVTKRTLTGKVTLVDQIDSIEMEEKTGRMQKTNLDEIDTAKRAIYAREFSKAIGFDEFDEDKLAAQRLPVPETMQKLSQAYERVAELVILQFLLGTNYEGEDGVTPVELPSYQTIPLTFHYDGTSANVGMTFDKFARLRRLAMENEAFGMGIKTGADQLCVAMPASGIEDLYQDVFVHHKEYVTAVDKVRNGEVDEFLGVFIARTEQVDTRTVGADTVRDCPAWCKSAAHFGIRNNYSAKMSVRDDLDEAIQLRAKAAIGGARMEEDAVWKLPIKVTS